MYKSIVLTEKDNVATALEDIPSMNNLSILIGNEKRTINLLENINFGHKFAIQDIAVGEEIIKYGEVIGRATKDINCGEYVHVHNLEGTRGRGDKWWKSKEVNF